MIKYFLKFKSNLPFAVNFAAIAQICRPFNVFQLLRQVVQFGVDLGHGLAHFHVQLMAAALGVADCGGRGGMGRSVRVGSAGWACGRGDLLGRPSGRNWRWLSYHDVRIV